MAMNPRVKPQRMPEHAAPPVTGPSGWRAGWLAGVRHHPSPNFGPRPTGAVVDLLVVHSISLPPGEFGGGNVDRLFTNTLDWDAHPYFKTIRGLEVSAHFVIDRQGEVTQYVGVFDRAWHAGASCWRGRSNCNDDSVGIELEGLEGGTFEPAQYNALAALCQAIAQACPIAHVAGHEHIARGRKLDPGPGFEWPRLVALLGWQGVQYPPNGTQQI
jgi:N-acetyl-anhydromuramyl-L-alanine amidase AmpD